MNFNKFDADKIGPIVLTICCTIVLIAILLTSDTCSTTETTDGLAAQNMFNNCVALQPNDVYTCGGQAKQLSVVKVETVCK